ncbi:MAG: CBS domain-containing protein [Trebonia sp.]
MKSTVKDVMTTYVVAVRRNASFKEMAARLREFRVSAFPVLDGDNKVIGVVSEADLLPKEVLNAGPEGMPGMIAGVMHHQDHDKAAGVTAGDLMTHPAVTITPEESAEHAARVMYVRKVKRLPVVDGEGHLVGIVSRADVLVAYTRPDEEIWREITGEVILNGFLMDPAGFDVTVHDGIVTLEGTPENRQLGRDIVATVRHVEGVVAVRDRLSYPPSERPASPGPFS